MMVNNYVRFYGTPDLQVGMLQGTAWFVRLWRCSSPHCVLQAFVQHVQNPRTDLDVLRENHRFLWDDDNVESAEGGRTLSADERYDARMVAGCTICSPWFLGTVCLPAGGSAE